MKRIDALKSAIKDMEKQISDYKELRKQSFFLTIEIKFKERNIPNINPKTKEALMKYLPDLYDHIDIILPIYEKQLLVLKERLNEEITNNKT